MNLTYLIIQRQRISINNFQKHVENILHQKWINKHTCNGLFEPCDDCIDTMNPYHD